MVAVEVATGYGRLRGERTDGFAVFRGVPFAAPPEGPRRLAPPARPTAWDGVRDAGSFAPACPQGPGRVAQAGERGGVFGGLFGPGELPTSEDCLYLNVWTPGLDDARRPVMVWIHGGAFRLGTGASPTYDGSSLARRGDVVVVTLNYRLGVLGYLHLPEIGSVNLGLLDQIAALEWVRENIAAFGGDPDQVTLFGESAGGKSIECLLAAPTARGLYVRAIVQSSYAPPMDPGTASAAAAGVLSELGLSPGDAERLRAVPVDDLLAASSRQVMAGAGAAGLAAGGGAGPVVDGEILPAAPRDVVAGGGAPVPLVIGTTADESRLFGAMMPGLAELTDEALAQRLAEGLPTGGPPPSAVIGLYREALAARGQPSGPADIWLAVSTDRAFRQHSIRLAEAQAAHQPVWMYLFAWPSPAWGGRLGACHAIDVPFVFGNLGGGVGQLVGEEPAATELAGRVQDAWLAFATGGDPNVASLPHWPPYDPGRRATMVLDRRCRVVDAPMEDERRLWEGVALP